MLRAGLTVKVTSEQRCEGGDRKSQVGVCMESIPGRRIASLKSPKEGINLERLKHGEVKEGGRPSRDETSTRRVCGAWLP